jgi:pyruvate/2-oxoglutarate dehydrogenase complex dihydrolipoamide acyltransferase (E2) component
MVNPKHSVISFPSSRLSTIDTGYIGKRKNHVQALLELDVTDARTRLKESRRAGKTKASFNVWILKCIAQAAAENKEVHALLKGRRSLITFDDVDISFIIEKSVEGTKVPLPVTLRKTNEKSLDEIHAEIEAAKSQSSQSEKDYVLGKNKFQSYMKLYLALPQFLRIAIMKFMLRDPFLFKEMAGTIAVTSVGMMGSAKGWAIPFSMHPLCFALGSIVKKPGVKNNSVCIREYLYLTVLMDHDVIDGAPAARFISRLSNLIENAQGI